MFNKVIATSSYYEDEEIENILTELCNLIHIKLIKTKNGFKRIKE